MRDDAVLRRALPLGRGLGRSALCQSTSPRHRLSTFGRRAFSVAGPTVWNSLTVSVNRRSAVIVSTNY